MLKLLLLAAGGACLVAAVSIASAKSASYANWHRAIGQVVAFRGVTPPPVQKGPQPEPRVSPVIAFEAGDGKARQLVTGWASAQPAYALGDRVPVLYDAANPDNAVVDSFTEKWGLPLMLAAAATLGLGLGLAIRGT